MTLRFGWHPRRASPDFWQDRRAIRADLFGTERLEHHALSLAAVQKLASGRPVSVRRLSARLKDNADTLLAAYRSNAAALQAGQPITPAAEWLLDNFHTVEAQVRQIRADLPPGYYRQLPKLAAGPFAGYPRVLELAWAYVAHTDSLFAAPALTRFVQAYQTVQPLTIGELWAVAITLRIVMIENMRRLSVQIVEAGVVRSQADALVDKVLAGARGAMAAVDRGLAAQGGEDGPDIFLAQIAKRLRGADPSDTPLLGWLEGRLAGQGASIDAVVTGAQQRQGAANVTMRNLVTSMRLLSELDWAEFFEAVSLIDVQLRQGSDFAAMDFATRNQYRTAIETLARGSDYSETAVTEAALATGNPGKALIGQQKRLLETALGFRPPWRLRLRRRVRGQGLPGYLGALGLASAAVLALALAASGAGGWSLVALALTGLAVAVEAGTALVNLAVTRSLGPRLLPGMALEHGIPPDLRVLVAVPVLLSDAADLAQQIERLEVHFLSSIGGAVHYALLSDGPDAALETTPQDAALFALATEGIAALNARHPGEGGNRFYLLHRHRLWNPAEGVWMGWERKRGKLVELNRLLRGATDTSFALGPPLPQDIRFVITLDADTRLMRDTVRRMVGKLAHPLNRARLDPGLQRVVSGYGILQPRVTPSLPLGQDGSIYQKVFSSPGGIEPYAAATSDVYQDLFDEGSFTGKGIYDVDAFRAALAGRVPENALLSHDLFEGVFARAGLASDIQVVEDFPARQDVDARRQHRWVRGDWQLLPWLTGRRRTVGGLPAVGRWKMVDNLRRSLLAPLTLASLLAGWLLPQAGAWTLAVLAMLALPHLLALPFAILPGRAGITSRSHLVALWGDTKAALAQIGLSLVLLADTAWLRLDAVGRSLIRLGLTRRHLLEWMTAAQSGGGAVPGFAAQYRARAGGVVLGLGCCGLALAVNPASLPVVLPFALLWLAAPEVARRISLPRAPRAAAPLSPAEAQALRLIARRTWRYFETFVTEADSFLPPDNFQETPRPAVAHRTSPTNIGLYLLSVTVAQDMGWIGAAEAVTRLEQTLQTLHRMPRHRGHLFNWHDTRDLQVLAPAYVSSVDSGNLAGHLIAVAQAVEAMQPVDPMAGARDVLLLAQACDPCPPLAEALARLAADPLNLTLATEAVVLAEAQGANPEALFWTRAMAASLAGDQGQVAPDRLRGVAQMARSFAMAMDFGFLLHPEKELLSIGFDVSTNALDTNCYDLLASEARLASLFAIAKGDVPTRHWFRLGRAATPIGAGSALISWSGSMFEYLMPALVMRAPVGSVLNETNRRVVQRQRAYADGIGLPWGISESAFNARDLEMTYQYSNFGVPGLGLKRGLAENRVIAPYATALAAMVDPRAALQNFARLAAMGATGPHGFYEALDFTASRLPADGQMAIVRSFMAHHQGMTITALANVVQNGRLRARFHAEPMIQAVELLLQERVPRDANAAAPRATDVQVSPAAQVPQARARHFDNPAAAVPTAHLLSNGSYGVMLTPTGEGFSRWRDMAISRWRPEGGHGGFVFLRDTRSGALWSAALQPTGQDAAHHAANFAEHHAAFTHHGPGLTTRTEVVVSGEDDAEARRVTLTNTGRRGREIEVTSYAELVLARAAADLAHPAFSKLFVVTDFLPELGVLIASRRRRDPADPEVWAAHIAVVEGEETAPLQYETDRAAFIGRGQNMATAALAAQPLTGSIGTVLDPVFSLRRRVLVPPGGRARVTFWTMLADTPEALLALVDRHREPSAFGRAVTLSWTQSQVQLRHHGVTEASAVDFQRLGGMLIRHDARLRASAAKILAGAAAQSRLWGMGISGDLPILLLVIGDTEDLSRLHEALAAQDYWRMRQLAVDLVILNDHSSSYVQDLQIAIETAVRSVQARPKIEGHGVQGAVHLVRADLAPPEARALLFAAADVVLLASRGGIAEHLDRLPETLVAAPPAHLVALRPDAPQPMPALEFFNGIGGFADQGREYVTVLDGGATTPAPWINVIANPTFGFQVSAEGSGFTWAENSRENQVTPWSNDPVSDPSGEAFYLHDLETGQVWTPTALPIRGPGRYTARHGFGYSVFQHAGQGIDAELLQFVPMDAAVKVSRLRLRNGSNRLRHLAVTGYATLVLGPSRSATMGHLITSVDAATGAVLAQNPRSDAFAGRVAFADFGGQTSLTCDRAGFLGRGGMADPVALHAGPLNGRCGPALDACAALQRRITLQPGEAVDLTFLLGQAGSAEAASALILATRARGPQAMLDQVTAHWTGLLGSVQITSPDRAMDIMLNGWLLYQTLACRIWARAGFYQASGAYGFRDQLQDGMALTSLRPEITRAYLLRAASRQFPEGDVQHWWLPHSGQGVRTRISDDRVWLAYAAAQYVQVSGDRAVFDEVLPFLDGPPLAPGVADDFFQPQVSDTTASLFEHCALGLDQAISLTGANGMPLIGTGDWNDGMNRVGAGGRGTSVWLGWLLIATLRAMAPHAESRDPARAVAWLAHADAVAAAIERDGWDGEWYRRGTYDDGTLLGSASSEECRIDQIAQSWAVLSGAADPARAATAMASVNQQLIRPAPGLALLFTPPFERSLQDPGYIKGYPPGLRENGGQYSHAAMWAILAQARLGHGDAAQGLFALLNPINHALTPAAAHRYKLEPYVIAADVYSTAPHEGRGGWSWYTGSAAWMYRAGIEGVAGLTAQGDVLTFDPCIPKAWPSLTLRLAQPGIAVTITILNPDHSGTGVRRATLNGREMGVQSGRLTLRRADLQGHLEIVLGHLGRG
ncbi:GH36-type glycosyl hydrolase domain-containing protein [Rhodobacter ferrooxidans]|uniref:Glycosyltransferase 36 n=1 Tax=Rhodobacter ferrooxidans TaxID=371731 RepID=C8RYI7_9RHOB|nr:glucoamylase family protein [Rhodobacter sp. SW2]EEW26175.1 glycosyltransferase 36 [Rhodobacter sp. SW2]